MALITSPEPSKYEYETGDLKLETSLCAFKRGHTKFKNVHELMHVIFIQISLKEIISFKCTGYHYKSERLIKQYIIVNCVICGYGIVYEMLNAIFQICYLKVVQV